MISRKFRLGSLDTRWLLKKGDQFTSNLFIVRYIQTRAKSPKFTVITSAKISKKAVERNTIKRRTYEAIRLNLKDIDGTWKVALIPKKRIIDIEYEKIEEDVQKILAHLAHLAHLANLTNLTKLKS